MEDKKVCYMLNSGIVDEFKNYCKKNGLVQSKQIEFIISDYLLQNTFKSKKVVK